MWQAQLLNSQIPFNILGEGPHWDAETGYLHWVDIKGKKLLRYAVETQLYEECPVPLMPGFSVPARANEMVTGLEDGLYKIDFATGAVSCIDPLVENLASTRFNDGKCDIRGRLWAGTMSMEEPPIPEAALYRFNKSKLQKEVAGLAVSNGLGWSPDGSLMYHTDTEQAKIWVCPYDIETGRQGAREVFCDLAGQGMPDGLCVDSRGRVYSALFGGGRINIYEPDGTLKGTIKVPVDQVTSCTFGMPDLKTLFITTGRDGMSKEDLLRQPLAGSIFYARMEDAGLPGQKFKFS